MLTSAPRSVPRAAVLRLWQGEVHPDLQSGVGESVPCLGWQTGSLRLRQRLELVPPLSPLSGHLVCVVVLLLPVQSLVKLYLYILSVLLLYVGHQTSQ